MSEKTGKGQIDDNCSGIMRENGEKICRHGFPLLPGCLKDPMTSGRTYLAAPCISEKYTERYYPDTGQPPDWLWR